MRGQTSRRPFCRPAWAWLVIPGLVFAACSTGTVNDARVGQSRDAEASPRLDQQQSTKIAGEFFPPTPSPPPVPPPPPSLESLVITLNVGAGDVPQGSFGSVPANAGTIYATALLTELVPGQVIEAVLMDMLGNELGQARINIAVAAGQQWVALPFDMDGSLPAGDYAVYLFGQDRRLGSVVFVVAPPGSVAQEFGPPPENPQVNVQPTAILTPRSAQSDRGGDGVADPPTAGAGVGNPSGEIVPATLQPEG